MRYLGALLELMNKMTPQPAQHVVTLILSEMITRAAKHLFRRLMRSVAREQQGDAISRFLNLFLSTYAIQSPKSAGKSKKNGKGRTTLFGFTSASFWEQIVHIVGSHFRYSIPADILRQLALPRLPILRSFCMKTGVQVLARDYDFHSREVPTFTMDDIMNLLPLVKQVKARATDASVALDKATGCLAHGNLHAAFEQFEESLALMLQTHGPLNDHMSACYRQLAWLNAQFEEFDTATDLQEKALMTSERCAGVDSADAIRHYINLGSYSAAAGHPRAGMAYLHHARRLVQLMHGSEHPDVANIDNTMAMVLLQNGRVDEGIACFERSTSLFNIIFGKKSSETFNKCVVSPFMLRVFLSLSHALTLALARTPAQPSRHLTRVCVGGPLPPGHCARADCVPGLQGAVWGGGQEDVRLVHARGDSHARLCRV
jgi:protein TIF31